MNGIMCSVIAVSQFLCSSFMYSGWMGNYGDALAIARNAERPLLLVLEKPTDPGGRLDEQLFDNTTPELLKTYQFCRVDITTEYGSKVAALYGATTYPYTVITDASCRKIVFRGTGRFTPARWRKTLETYRGTSSNWDAVDKVEAVDDEFVDEELVEEVPPGELFAHADLASAQAAARRRKRPLLVFVTMSGCHYCERMKAETFADTELTEQIASEFETVVVQQENDSAWVQQQHITMFPTTLVFSPSGTRLGRFDGFVATGKLRQRLRSFALGRLTSR